MVTVYTRAIMSASVWGTAAWHAATIPANGNGPQPLPSGRTDLGCTMVADGRFWGVSGRARRVRFPCKSLVDRTGLEPLTSAVQGGLCYPS